MTTVKPGYYGRSSYEGNIQDWSQQPRQLYQGNIDNKNVKPGRLYQGTIDPRRTMPKGIDNMPGRSNPYRYYELPENYYGAPKRTKSRSDSQAKLRKKILQESIKKKKKESKEKKVEQKEKKVEQKEKKVEQKEKKVEQKKEPENSRQKTPPKIVPTAVPKKSQPPPQKPKSQGNKHTPRVSPFPSPSPEPEPRQVPKRHIEPVTYRNKPEPVLPSILPVTMEDFVKREPMWRSQPHLPIRQRRSPDNFFANKENYHDSLSRSFPMDKSSSSFNDSQIN